MAVVDLLKSARADWGDHPFRHGNPQIVLSSSIHLIPERERLVAGYRITAHLRSPRFAIEAHPVSAGTSGVFCFFLDYTGKLHFEPTLGKAAC